MLTADIVKMYRQFMVDEKHQNLQRILYRFSPSDPVKDYVLLTVTYGEKASPHLAVRCLVQCATDHEKEYPLAAELIRSSFYVDDLITSVKTPARTAHSELTALLAKAKLELSKWNTNSPEVKALIGDSKIDNDKPLVLADVEMSSVLGVKWNPTKDAFTLSIEQQSITKPITKRFIAQEIAKTHDPLGLVMPCIIIAKLILQKLQGLKIGWDEVVPSDIQIEWQKQHEEFI